MSAKKRRQGSQGFIALVSAVIISAVLLLITSSLSLRGISFQLDGIDSVNKKISRTLAETCLNTAEIKLKQDENYSGSETILQNLGSCAVCPVIHAEGYVVLHSRSVIQNAFTNLEMKLNSPDYSINYFSELSTYPLSDCSF